MGIVQRGRELAIQGGNDSLDNDQRNGIAAEVLMMKDRLSQVVNTKFHNRYISLKDSLDKFGINLGTFWDHI